ncbi:hypothetical protein NET02_02055 [Thermomicrobiaceae bacterium CFH 74404]|uniref:Uncharacterized protein n=1 Tax=Thermalbibacter longus TaxID=2951981 RepID=A0AA41WCR9_9BACT|nr:hypothetical protein [Thermalbibacter longus]MCM8747925.1 hypothetical protein [Thermalbibacter longus]
MMERELDADALLAAVKRLRREHPETRIVTELVAPPGEHVVVRVTVELPGHGSVSALGSAEAGESPRWVELAEDRALQRALDRLGSATLDALAPAGAGTPTSPVTAGDRRSWDQGSESLKSARAEGLSTQPAELVGVMSSPGKADVAGQASTDIGPAGGIGREPGTPPASAAQARYTVAGPEELSRRESREPRPATRAEYGWDEFWRWARARGFSRKDQIAEALGYSVTDLTPRELRAALEAHLRQRRQ